jgi:DNA-binding CsgD family transcriptional regulator
LLRGRASECARLDRLLEAAHGGESAALVVRGEAGIGKTALLEYAAARGADCRIARATGVEAEMELPYAALHHLCLGLLDGTTGLPAPQRDALETAFGLSPGPQPDRFLIGVAVLSLMSDAARSEPLVCIVDDAQWLDRSSAQVLAFVARRLQMESVLALFAERAGAESGELAGLPELRLGGIPEADARELLASTSVGPVDERVRNRIIAEARGNPLALIELGEGPLSAGLEGGYALPGGVPTRIEAGFRRQVEALPEETQHLLVVAAAEPLGDPGLLWRAVGRLEIPPEAASVAEDKDLMEIGARVTFRHPLLRSAIYRGASPDERGRAHLALAETTDPDVDPDRRAWHRAHAAIAPDEDVAAELESSANRARARGGMPAAAAFLERSAELTPDPGRRAVRALEAAQAKRLAGIPDSATALLTTAVQGPLGELDRALAQRLRGQIALDLSHSSEAAPLLLDAARRLEPLDMAQARETHLESLWAASAAGRFGDGGKEAAEAARAAPRAPGPPGGEDLLLDGLAVLFTDGYSDGVPILKRALAHFRDEPDRSKQDLRWPWMAARVAAELLDLETWRLLASRDVQVARQTGALSLLPVSLGYLAAMSVQEGDLESAAALMDESDAIAATGSSPAVTRLILHAWRGDEAETSRLIAALEPQATARGDGLPLTASAYARAILHNGLGNYDDALAAAQEASALDNLSVTSWSLPDLIEAAVRSHRPGVAESALDRLTERTQVAGTDFALGIEARSRALVGEGVAAEEAYREAIEVLGRTRGRLAMARAHLLYGEWLRRENRRVDARGELRTAHELLSEMGADGFAGRARRELAATGEKVRRRTVETRDDLTPQEVQIASLAVDGLTNPEIGAQLFLSPRTVEWHLSKVYGKLGISARKELGRALPEARRTRASV